MERVLESVEGSDSDNRLMNANIHINAGLMMSGAAADHRIHGMLSAAAKKQLGERQSLNVTSALWPAEYFGLSQVDLFVEATEQEQLKIVELCSLAIVEEAFLIEKCGMAFGAKMAALADSVEERMFYCLMSGEETIHYHQIRQFLPNKGIHVVPNAFHRLLADLIESGDRSSLVFVIQVVLEGWGLSHYKSLADNCLTPAFSLELREILKDESRHHGTGVAFTKQRSFDVASADFVVGVLVNFLQMIQVGPQSVVSALEKVLGTIERGEKIKLLRQLDAEVSSAATLHTLRTLMIQNGGVDIVARLDKKNCFTPFPVENCL